MATRYQTLFEALDAVFCVVEVKLAAGDGQIDYKVVEANPAFYRQTAFLNRFLVAGCARPLPRSKSIGLTRTGASLALASQNALNKALRIWAAGSMCTHSGLMTLPTTALPSCSTIFLAARKRKRAFARARCASEICRPRPVMMWVTAQGFCPLINSVLVYWQSPASEGYGGGCCAWRKIVAIADASYRRC